MTRRPLLAAAVATLLGASGCLMDDPELGTDESAIVNGSIDEGDDAIVALTIQGQQFCTGTLVSPTIVVTAAHCLPPNLEVPMNAIEVFFGADINGPGTFIQVSEGLAHAAWSSEVVPNDIGAISLVEPAPVAPMRMLSNDLDLMSPIGETVRMVGYGITAFEGTGNGVKRSGEMTIEAIDASTIYLGPGPSLTCNGDSGGPLLMDVDGSEVFAGIHSRSDCDSNSLNERVDVHAAGFIRDFITAHTGGAECIADGLCAEDCATPDPDCPLEPGDCDELDPDCEDGSDLGGDLVGGCSTGGSGSMPGAALLVALALWIRRRRD